MDKLELLVDLFKECKRQGPGSSIETRRALSFLDLDPDEKIKIADIGCGCGAQTITLARNTNSHITAIDIFPEFLDKLDREAQKRHLNIETVKGSMKDLPFKEESLDIMWSEGAIYFMGFEKGIQEWRKFIKPNGYLVVSDISWFTESRPQEINDHWKSEVDIKTVSQKISAIERSGYSPIAYFKLPEYCWTEKYYKPFEQRIPDFLDEHNDSKLAREIVENERIEIDLYKKYKDYYGYGFYIARRV